MLQANSPPANSALFGRGSALGAIGSGVPSATAQAHAQQQAHTQPGQAVANATAVSQQQQQQAAQHAKAQQVNDTSLLHLKQTASLKGLRG